MYALHYKLYTMKIHLNISIPSYQYNRVLTDFHSFSIWHQSCKTSAPKFLHSMEGILYRRFSCYLAWNILFWPYSIMSANNWIHFKMLRFAGHQHKKIYKRKLTWIRCVWSRSHWCLCLPKPSHMTKKSTKWGKNHRRSNKIYCERDGFYQRCTFQ